MAEDEMKKVPRKPIDVALGVLRDNGYVPVEKPNPDISRMGISEWKLPGSNTSIGVKQEGTQVAVMVNFSFEKKNALLDGKAIPASFTVQNMNDLMRFAQDFVKNAQARGVPLPKENEFAIKKQKIGPG